ncbi:hypothetical protein IQ06DRAFT_189462, partial [Phaeosphaeriaceae sp. SRC1lsM3a]
LILLSDCPRNIAETHFLTTKLAGIKAANIQTFRKRYQEFELLDPSIVKDYGHKGTLLEI